MSIFQKKTGSTDYFDQIMIDGYNFDISVTVMSNKERGNPSAIHCGRIISFQMTCDDDVIALFDDGSWYNLPGEPPFSNDRFSETAKIAMETMIRKWSNPEKIRVPYPTTDLF